MERTNWNISRRSRRFPLILPTITSAALLVFMTSLADFGTPMLIGEGFKTLPVVVYDEFMSELGGNAAMASTLSVIIVVFSLSVLFMKLTPLPSQYCYT